MYVTLRRGWLLALPQYTVRQEGQESLNSLVTMGSLFDADNRFKRSSVKVIRDEGCHCGFVEP